MSNNIGILDKEKKTQEWKWDFQLKASAITHPRNGEQETVKMVRLVLEKEELTDFLEWKSGVSGR